MFCFYDFQDDFSGFSAIRNIVNTKKSVDRIFLLPFAHYTDYLFNIQQLCQLFKQTAASDIKKNLPHNTPLINLLYAPTNKTIQPQ